MSKGSIRACFRCGVNLPTGRGGSFCPACLMAELAESAPVSATGTPTVSGPVPAPDAGAEVFESVGSVIGRYKLREKLGEGGFGRVWVAEQLEPVRRRVALKLVKLGMDTPQVFARFEAERQALALMDHPNIARVFDAGTTATGRPYFVMEWVRGVKITDYCDRQKLTTRQRLELFVKVCQAVQHAHQKGIVHRDLKPSNVLVAVTDGLPVPKVIDFGIAKAVEGHLTDKTVYTEVHQLVGTPAYMSPEQTEMTSLDIDTRSDIYSLGVLLYELLTGRTPFDAKRLFEAGLDEIRRTIREVEPPRPSTRLSTLAQAELATAAKARGIDGFRLLNLLRGDLDWIVMKALEKDRTRRYETANGFAADVERYLRNEPVIARPPSAAYRLRKTIRRNRLVFAAGAAIGLALVVGSGVSLWQAARATAAQRLAQLERDRAISARRAAEEARRAAESAQQSEKEARLREEAEKSKSQRQLYVANLNLAQQAWEQNHFDRLRDLIGATQSSTHRGFEWFYWQRMLHRPARTLHGHKHSIYSLAFSPDGQRLVSGSWDHTAKVWDVSTGKELLTLAGHAENIYAVSFSPDGQRIATGSIDHTARIWDANTGEPLFTIPNRATPIHAVVYSPDGSLLAIGDKEGRVSLWNVAGGTAILGFTAHSGPVGPMAFSDDGRRLVTGSADAWVPGSGDHSARIWDVETGRELLLLTGHTAQVGSVGFSPDGKWVLTGSMDHTARIWDAHTGKPIRILDARTEEIGSASFSPDGRKVVAGTGKTATVWDAQTGEILAVLKGHSAGVNAVAFSPDGRWIATGCGDWIPSIEHTIKLWPAENEQEVLALPMPTNFVMCASFSPDSKRAVIGGGNTMKVLDASTGRELLAWKHPGKLTSGAANPDPCAMEWSAFSPDGKWIVTANNDHSATVWESGTGREMLVLKGHQSEVFAADYAPDGRTIATGSWDATVILWDSISGRKLLAFNPLGGRVWAVDFSPDGRKLVVGGDAKLRVCESATGTELMAFDGHEGPVISVAFSPDGRRIASASSDRTARLWDAETGKELFTLRGHGDQVWAIAFSPDGGRVVTGSLDGTAKLWDVDLGTEVLTLNGHRAAVRYVAFSPDGLRILTGGWDKIARIWTAARPEQVAAWEDRDHAGAK